MPAVTPVMADGPHFTDVVALIGTERAFDAADHAAHRGANHGADRAGDAIAFMKAMLGAARDALRMGRERHEECGNKRASNKQVLFHQLLPFLR